MLNFTPTRREVLKIAGAGVAAGTTAAACSRLDRASTNEQGPRGGNQAGGSGAGGSGAGGSGAGSGRGRALVVIELGGGNDGLSMLAPVGHGRYHDARPTVALAGKEVEDWGDGWGLHKSLAQLQQFGLAALHGVGTHEPDLSHFEMTARWQAGTPRALGPAGTGFLGRLSDQLAGDELLTAVSLDLGQNPALISDRSRTSGLAIDGGLGILEVGSEETQRRVARAFNALAESLLSSGTVGSESAAEVRRATGAGLDGMLAIATLLRTLPDPETEFPETDFGTQLRLASQLLRSDSGFRIIHIPMNGGSFDTHDNHRDQHNQNMTLLGDGLAAFGAELAALGMEHEVLTATVSEFGRRFEENSGGLDHGTASTALMMGPVAPGMHGEPPSLKRLDEDSNLIATLEFDRYLATMAQWMSVDPEAVLAGAPRGVEGLLTA